MTHDDVVLAISNSGQTDELLRFIPMVLHMNIPIIGMSGNPESLLAKYSSVHINVKVQKEACLSISHRRAALLLRSQWAMLSGGGADGGARLQTQGFAQFHPGGSLGKRLLHHCK